MNTKSTLFSLLVFALAACGDKPADSGNQKTNSGDAKTDQSGPGGDNPQTPVTSPVTIGSECDWSVDFRLRCQDNSVVACDPLTNKWTATPCGNKICVEDNDGTLAEEAACYKSCDPNNYPEQHDCEDPDAIGTNPIGTTYTCQKTASGEYAVLISQKYCSECNGKECVIDEADYGHSLGEGDGCNTFLFEPRCQNGVLYNCEQQTEHPSEIATMVYGTVIKRECQSGCQIVTSYDKLKFAICNEDDSAADYYCSVHQDSDFCSIRECFVDHATTETKTVCTWELYPIDSEYCSSDSINYWHTGYGCK